MSMLALARLGALLGGVLCIVVAAIMSPELVRARFALDGILTPTQAAVLPVARLMLAGFGGALLLLAAVLPRIVAAPWWLDLMRSRRRLEWSIFLLPPLLLLALLGYKLLRGPQDALYLIAVHEDSVVEWLTALAYMASVIVCWVLARRLGRERRYVLAAFHVVLGLACLFVALEEISYGQRLAGFATPQAVAERNVQNEMNLHNLDFTARLFFTIAPLGVGLFGLAGFVLPAFRRWLGEKWAEFASFLVPPWFLASWFVPIALFALYAAFFWGTAGIIVWQDQEPLEALLAFGFLAFVLTNLGRVRAGEAAVARGSDHGDQPLAGQGRADRHRRHDRVALRSGPGPDARLAARR
jgi:hypothetical protein